MFKNVVNHYVYTIVRSKILLDDDFDVILDNCEVICENRTTTVTTALCSNLKKLSFVCFWCVSVYKFDLFTIAPTAFTFLKTFYNKYTLERYKNNIEELIQISIKLHKINSDLLKYLKARELFNNGIPLEKFFEHFKKIFNEEIALIDYLMCKTALLCEFTNKIQPETWKIQDLQLEIFNNQEECFENFLKLHDVIVLTISKFLACIAVTVSRNEIILFCEIVPNALKFLQKRYVFIDNEFKATRTINLNKQNFINNNDKVSIKPTVKLENYLSNLLTHLQFTFQITEQIHSKLNAQQTQLEDLCDSVFNLQEQLLHCEQNLDQFCGVYGILIKKRMVKEKKNIEIVDTVEPKNKTTIVNVDDEINLLDEIVEGDEEYELYIKGDDYEGNDDDKCGADCEDTETSNCLLLVLQELKDRLKERQILRAKKLGLPTPPTNCDDTVLPILTKEKVKPPIFVDCSSTNADFVEIGTSSFANAIKLLAQQRQQCEEEIFEDSDGSE